MKRPVIIPPPEPEHPERNWLPVVMLGCVAFWGLIALIVWL